jgi:hypothetical protein
MSRPLLKVNSLKCMKRKYHVLQFCSNISFSIIQNVFVGIGFLDFLKDVLTNLNHKKKERRWGINGKVFAQTIKIYSGHCICDMFQLIFF